MKVVTKCIAALLALGMLGAAAPAAAQEKIVVWWVKGFYPSEDAALFEAVKKFEAKTGVKVDLSQYAVQDGIPKTVAALDSGNPPDVAYIDVYDFQVLGKWAYEGKLEDLTDVLTPIKGNFLPNTLETTYLYNDKTKKRAYYGFPIKQQTMHIEYWKDMLAEAGDTAIPETWKEYWAFWCDKAQPDYRKKTGKRIFGTGFPMGVDSSDSFFSFLTFMDAYNVKLVDDNGKVTVSDPKVRQGMIGAVRDYTMPYTKGCTPPSATSWKDPDNNVAFHNKTTIMTHNATISIAAKWFDDMNNEKLTPAEREQAILRALGAPRMQAAHVGIGVGDHLVAPLDELAVVLLGNAEDLAQDADRKHLGDLLDEIELALRERPVEDDAGQLAEQVLLGSELLVEVPRGDAGLGAQLGDLGGREARAGEERQTGLQQPSAAFRSALLG